MKRILYFFITSSILLVISPTVFAQLYWDGAGGTWTSAGWSNTNSAPYTQPYISGSAVYFNVEGAISGIGSINFSSITANENMTLISATNNTMSTGGTNAIITVAPGKTLDLSSQKLAVANGTGITKNGLGVLALAGGSYPAGFTLNAGTVIARSVDSFGSGILTVNGGTIATNVSTQRDFTGKQTSIIFGGNFTLGATTGLASSTGDLIFNAPVSLGPDLRVITLNGAGINTFGGIISGAGGLSTGAGSTGTLLLSGANAYSGSTILSGGSLVLGAADVIPDASSFVFNGGTLKTGAFSESYSTLNISENSILTLVSSPQTHTFAASNAISWTAGKTLTIIGWAGTYDGTSGTGGKIFVGNSATGLTAQQLSQIKFYNGSVSVNAKQLPTGEVVPDFSVLPISLTTFTAKPVDKAILLNWKTASEKGNKSFEVLRSTDGKAFTSITTLDGAGDSDSEKSYSFLDENPFAAANYYKLVQYDFNGQSTSKTITVNLKLETAQVFISTTNSSVDLNISSPTHTKATVYLYDLKGSKIAERSLGLTKGNNILSFTESLTPGIYFVSVITKEIKVNSKFAK